MLRSFSSTRSRANEVLRTTCTLVRSQSSKSSGELHGIAAYRGHASRYSTNTSLFPSSCHAFPPRKLSTQSFVIGRVPALPLISQRHDTGRLALSTVSLSSVGPDPHPSPASSQVATDISAGNAEGFWSHTLYTSSQGDPIRVHYCSSKSTSETVASSFLEEPILGFDMEWESSAYPGRNSIKDCISVIQIASADRVAIFHLAMFRGDTIDDLMSPSLRAILETDTIAKAGVNIAGDFTRLRKCLEIEGRGIFELSHLYKLVRYSEQQPELINRIPAKLEEQVQYVFGLPLQKGEVRTSAWSGKLSNEQINYAVTDAYAGLRLFDELDRRRKALKPMPPLPAYYELGLPIILGNGMPPPRRQPQARSIPRTFALSNDDPQKVDISLEITSNETNVNNDNITNNTKDRTDSISTATKETDARLSLAETWAHTYRLARSEAGQSMANPAAVRAYALWQRHNLSPEEIRRLLRHPPLKPATVNAYIFETVALDRNLPFDDERMRSIFASVPGFLALRFKTLARRVGAL